MERRNRATLHLEINYVSFFREIQELLKTKGPNHLRLFTVLLAAVLSFIFPVFMVHLMTGFLFSLMCLNSVYFVSLAAVLLSLYSFMPNLKI